MSLRAAVAESIKQLLPDEGKAYTFDDAHVSLGQITKPAITVLLKGYRHADIDADVSLIGEFVVTIASPLLDVNKAEADLDDDVARLLLAIDRLARTRWTAASRVIADEKYHGWDLTIETLCQINTDPTPEA